MEIDRCAKCGGLWLDRGEFTRLLKTRKKVSKERIKKALAKAGSLPDPETLRPTLRCPRCSELMIRFGCGRKSRVILDRCDAHGGWFDGDELEDARILTRHYEFRGEDWDQVKAVLWLIGLLAPP